MIEQRYMDVRNLKSGVAELSNSLILFDLPGAAPGMFLIQDFSFTVNYNETDRVMALAGILQASSQVEQVAKRHDNSCNHGNRYQKYLCDRSKERRGCVRRYL